MNDLDKINEILDYAEKSEVEILEITKRVDLDRKEELNIEVASVKYYDLLEKRDEINTKILATMFGNGVILDSELSVRRGEFYPYRSHSHIGLRQVRKIIIEHLHKMTKDLQDENKDILEFCLSKIDDGIYGTRYWDEAIKKEIPSKVYGLKKTYKMIRNRNEYSKKTFEFIYFNKIILTHEGVVKFILGLEEDKKKKKNNFVYENDDRDSNFGEYIEIPSGFKKLLMIRFATEIEDLRKKFEDELTPKIAEVEKDIDELKARGGKLLVLSHLTQKAESEDNPI